MATQYYNANVVNPDTGERGMWYYTDMTTAQAADATAAGGGTYRSVEGNIPEMTSERQDMTTEQFSQTWRNDYPSIPITSEGLAELAPTLWAEEEKEYNKTERLEYLEQVYSEAGVQVLEEMTSSVSIAIFGGIINALNNISLRCYDIYLEILGWVYPFWLAAEPFWGLSNFFNSLAWHFYDFASVFEAFIEKARLILSWNTIWSYIQSYIPNWNKIGNWFSEWYSNVLSITNTWWSSTQLGVWSWISAAKSDLLSLMNNLTGWLGSLQVEWSGFLTTTLPNLANWTGVDGLIKSWFSNFTPFWEGWQEIKEQVVDFFSDPEQWFYDRLDNFFERFW